MDGLERRVVKYKDGRADSIEWELAYSSCGCCTEFSHPTDGDFLDLLDEWEEEIMEQLKLIAEVRDTLAVFR